ncbi:MAG: geranylgeranylglycerol-phosphate geranylgeranyltransferase, partial [Flavobacteriales bacterium]
MKGLVAFFRLVRPVNLLIIVFTMVAMRWGVIAELAHDFNPGTKLQMDHWKFVLSVLVMVLLAASGNIINDYFDLKVDRINKPEKVIVGKLVKRRVAMISHHALNALAVLIGFYLAWDSGMYWIGLVPIIMGTLLWFYSLKFKKAPWIGNFVVALMVAVVPLWAGVFEIPLLEQVVGIHSCMHFNPFVWFTLGGFSLFAFWLTLIREAIKDLEDLEGDSRAGF